MTQDTTQNEPAENDEHPAGEYTDKPAWYFNPGIIVLALLCLGPLALPLVWTRPNTPGYIKTAVTILIVAATIWMTRGAMSFYGELMETYNNMPGMMSGAQ